MLVSYYPRLNKTNTMYSAHSDITGSIEIDDEYLYFNAKWLLLIKIASESFEVELSDIISVDKVTLNGVLPFGVCITLENGREIMFGSVKQKKLYNMIVQKIKTEE